MLHRKICLLGAPGVGKRSLLSTACAQTAFSGNYVATIGAQIGKRRVSVGEQSVEMMVWDIADYEGFEKVELPQGNVGLPSDSRWHAPIDA
jgi:Ras-related protein Rab-7A